MLVAVKSLFSVVDPEVVPKFNESLGAGAEPPTQLLPTLLKKWWY